MGKLYIISIREDSRPDLDMAFFGVLKIGKDDLIKKGGYKQEKHNPTTNEQGTKELRIWRACCAFVDGTLQWEPLSREILRIETFWACPFTCPDWLRESPHPFHLQNVVIFHPLAWLLSRPWLYQAANESCACWGFKSSSLM